MGNSISDDPVQTLRIFIHIKIRVLAVSNFIHINIRFLAVRNFIHIKIRVSGYHRFLVSLGNLLPDDLSKFCPEQDTSNIVGSFKKQLDKFLAKFPDQPTIQGHARAANSNSLLDQRYYMNLS